MTTQVIKKALNAKYGKGVLAMNKLNIADEKLVNQNETVEMAMHVITTLKETSFNFKDISFYKDSKGDMRFRLEF